jgi:hypothetical protein
VVIFLLPILSLEVAKHVVELLESFVPGATVWLEPIVELL